MPDSYRIAYFSMEMMLETDIPTYAGGLGVLAGDILRSCADLHIQAVGVSLVYNSHTFNQVIEADGRQTFTHSEWQRLDQLTKLPQTIDLTIAGTPCRVGVWRYDMVGFDGFVVPVYLLDTNIIGNLPWIRNITQNLYAIGDYRLMQEIVLGIGGVKMLRALGVKNVGTYHMNEGHAALVPLALLAERNWDENSVRSSCVFTTHTPIPEGHDRFPYDMAWHFAGPYIPWHIQKIVGQSDLSMTHLALNMSHKVFAVSKKHQEVSMGLFPGHEFDYVTNGVHHRSWVHNYVQDFLNDHLPGWLEDPGLLQNSMSLPGDQLWLVHQECKAKMINYVNYHLTAVSTPEEREHPNPADQFDTETLTISLARRPVAYKRPLLLYHDLERFARVGAGKLQIIQCGKSHQDDMVSQHFVSEIISFSKKSRHFIKITYLENYSPKIARMLVSGSDLWLNTPIKPLEASGTSGMKAAGNGVLNFSVPDGWWIEGYAKNSQAGFNIGSLDSPNDDQADADSLYSTLESQIMPLYYNNRPEWINRMKQAISLGSHFNTHRVVREYLQKGWS